ncbi:hypothetical protein PPERSA_10698 [Pseudocohnilembus persalinus]|uniref:EF-hand domain-containing protein n=1 Tax=Pseudocohnilembus persalinus TaxID=266149 RepID=A0A0V0QDC2_PSEPJ|nr:hypothetical protein PPERSA_10698 [Pseudocohnilembus persalinus]|eukprot:KRX00199.1 hypothetical protein PPERSA_10698 [Pseudocohnilembus persalinus]
MNRPFDGFGFEMPELPKQLDKFFDEKASDYTNAKQAKIKKININYQNTRVRPEILDYIFKDFKNSENTEDYLKNLNVLFQQMKDKKYFQDIHLLNSYKKLQNIGQDESKDKIQDQNQNQEQLNQESKEVLNKDNNSDFSQKIQEIPEKIVEKAEDLKEKVKDELNINENEVELNIDAFIKDRKMFQSFIGPVNSLKSNILRGKAEIQAFNLFRNLEKISISANAAALQGFEKKQGRLSVKVPLFGHDMFKSVVYQTKITDKKLFSKNFMEMRQQNDINEHSFTHSIRFKPHNENHDFSLVQKFRNNVYNNLQDRNQDNVESNQLKSQQMLRLDYTYVPKINIQYELLQNDKEQKDKKKKVIVNQIPESEKGETVVSKIFTSAQALSISNRLLFNNSYSGQPAYQTKIQFQSQSYTKFSHHFKKLKTYGRFSYNNTSIATVTQKVIDQLNKRGATTIRGLARVFKALDSYDGNKKVDKEEFYIGLKENGVNLNKQEASILMSAFDTNGDGYIDFDEFLVAIRGRLNEKRQEIVDQAFKKMDKDGSGRIEVRDLQGVYDASQHPKVQNGTMTETQVFQQFLQSFGDQDRDGVITKDEWDNYYAAVSSSIDNDDHFVHLLTTAWRLNE